MADLEKLKQNLQKNGFEVTHFATAAHAPRLAVALAVQIVGGLGGGGEVGPFKAVFLQALLQFF